MPRHPTTRESPPRGSLEDQPCDTVAPLEGRVIPQAERTSPGYGGIEIFVPLPEFGRRIHPD